MIFLYLYDISLKIKSNSKDMIDIYFDNLDKNLNSIKSIYLQGKSSSSDNNNVGIGLQISNLQQIYNNENYDMDEYNLILSFRNEENKIDKKYKQTEFTIKFNTKKNEIKNINDLFYKIQYPINQFPKYIIFTLISKNKKQKATFSYKLLDYELMKLSKIILENKEEINK